MDIESDSSGAKFVTRKSVEQCWIARNAALGGGRPRPRSACRSLRSPGSPATALRELMDLVRAGVLEQVSGTPLLPTHRRELASVDDLAAPRCDAAG